MRRGTAKSSSNSFEDLLNIYDLASFYYQYTDLLYDFVQKLEASIASWDRNVKRLVESL